MAGDDVAALIDDLAAEQAEVVDLVADLPPDGWFSPTPARGWDVRDTIAHLAHTDELACDTLTGGPRSLNEYAARHASPEDTTYAGVLAGRRTAAADVLAWWRRAQEAALAALLVAPADQRVPWGLGMRLPSFVSARLMETWAHGLDIADALGVARSDTDRLRHVAWIGVRALPYAFSKAGRAPPDEPVRFELDLPSGARFEAGPPDARDRVTGPAAAWCRVVVQRRSPAEEPELAVEGDAAQASVAVARAFL